MTPEQRIARQQKEAEADIRRAILGQETFEIKALDEGDAHSIVPDKTKFTRDIAVASWMDGINGKDNIPGTMDWQANKDALAQEYFKQDVRGISDDDFAGLVRDHITAQSAFADVAFTAAAKETPLSEAIKEARDKSGLFGIGHKFAANQGRYLADFTRQYADTKEKLFPYREQINQLTEMGRNAEERIVAGEGSPWEDMAKVMLTIPAEDREDVLHAIAAQDKKEGETEKDAFTRTVLAFDRGLERYVMTAGEGMRDIGFTALMAGAAAESAEARRFGAPAEMPESFIRPEEEQQMDFLKRQMSDLSRGSLDPLDRVELLGMSISGAAENLPMMATSFIPYVGPAMMLGSFKAETEYQLRQQYPEMDSATVEGFSMLAAPFQAASEVIGDRLVFGRLPNLGRLINAPAFRSGAIAGQLAGRVGIGGAVEYSEEFFQQAFPQVMVDLAEAMGADIPDVNWGDFWRDWKANQGELIATIIPLVLLGSGVGQFSDFQNSRALARDQDLLVAAGYSVENAAKIKEFADAGKWGEAQDLMLKDWRAVNAKGVSIPEVSNEAATKILAEREAAREKVIEKLQQVQDDVGRIAAQGGYSLSKVAGGWQVTTPDSQVTVGSAEEATALLQNHYNEAERENILAVAKLADELEKQGDTQRVEIKPGERVEIKWEDNQQAVEVAARMAGLTPEQAKRVTFSVLGSNRFEHAEGLKRAVSTIFQGGNVLTMVEETVEGRFKRALDTGALTKEEATKMVQLAESIVNEGKTGADRQTIFDTQAADQDRALIEAVSKIVYLDVFGRRKEGGRFTPGLISRGLKAAVQMRAPTEALAFQMQQAAQGKTAEASQMHAFLSAFRTLFGSVFKAARALKQARAQGRTEELDTFINKLIGVQTEMVEQEATVQAAQDLLTEMPQLEGQPYETFSIVPSSRDPYKDRSGEDAGSPLTDTEILEGIEDEQGTLIESPIEIAELDEVLDDPSLPDIPWGDNMESFSLAPDLKPWKQLTREDLKKGGKQAFAFYADRMRVGTYTGLDPKSGIKIPLQGGFNFPAQVEMIKNMIAWAVSDAKTVRSMITAAKRTGGHALIALFSRGNVTGNATFLKAYFEELRWNIKQGKITEQQAVDFFHEAKQTAGVLNNAIPSAKGKTDKITGEKIPPSPERVKQVEDKRAAFANKKWQSLNEIEKALGALSFKVRGSGFFKTTVNKKAPPGTRVTAGIMGTQALVKAGMPDVAAMVELMEEPAFSNLSLGTIVGIVEVDPNQEVQTAKELGVTPHLSYPYVVRGKRVGVFKKEHHIEDFIKRKPKSSRIMEGEAMASTITFSMRPSFEDRLTGVFSPLMRDPVVRRELAQRALEKAKSAAAKLGKLKKGEVTPQEQRDRTVAGLRVLNAALAAMPPVVRTRVGGFIAVAQRTTAEGMMREIERRIAKLDVELERYLAEEATQEAEDLFDRYKSQRDSGGRQASKILASGTEQIDYALGIYDLDDEQQDTTIGGLQKRIDDADNADDLADAMNKLAIAELFSHWEKQDSESRYAAVDWMRDIIETGKLGRSIIDEERKQFLAALKEDARTSVLGDVRASLAEAENKDNQTDSSAWQTFVRNVKSAGGSLLWTTAQQIELLFGADSQVYKYFTDKIVEAANLSTDIKTAADKRRVAFMQQLFDTKSSLKLAQAMARLQKARSSGVFVNVGRVVEKVKIPVEVLERLSDGTVTPEDIGLNDAQAQQALEDFAAAGPMKRQIEVEKVVNAGEQVEKFMSEGQGIMWFLWSRQDVSRKQMERDGWNEDSLKQLDAFLSDEAKAIADFIAQDLQMAGDMIDPVYRRLFNAPMPRNKNYAPIYRLKPADTAAMDFEAGMSSGLDAGFTKARVNNSLPLREMDAFVVFLSHWEHVSHWVSHAELMRDMKSVMFNANVQNAIRTKSGKGALEGINNRLKAIESNGNRAAWDLHSVNKIWSNLTKFRAFKGLAFRVSPVVKQTSAFLNPLLADVPAHAYAIGLANAFGDPVNFASDVAAMWESPIIQRRLDGGFSAEARIAMGRAGITGSTLIAAMQKGMMPMAMTDAGWTALGAAISFRYYKKVAMREEGTTEEQANAIAMKRVERMIATSAQPADLVNRALIENQTNPIVKSLWMFASESRKSLAIELMAMRNLAKGKEVGMNIQRILVAHFVQAAVTQLMGSFLMSIMGDDDDKERAWSLDTWALSLALGPINGLFVLGSVIDTAARRAAGMYTFPSELLPGQVYSVTEKAVRNIDDLFQDDPDSVLDEIDKISAAVGTIMSTIFGPAGGAVDVFGNVARDARKIYKSQTED